MKLFKKHIALFCFLVLSIPTLIQGIHLFENHDHEHLICTSDTEQHYHEIDTVDCSLFHFQFEVFSSDIMPIFSIIPIHLYNTHFNEQPQLVKVLHPLKKTTRGPPMV